MIRKGLAISGIITFLLTLSWTKAHSQIEDLTSLKGPYLGQQSPGKMPKVFAPGIISLDDYAEFNCLFWDNGKHCLFQREGGSDNGFFETELIDGSWTPLKKVDIFGAGDAFEPGITPDGQKIYFNSLRPTPTGAKKGITWMISRENNGWSEPVYCEYGGMFPSLDQYGNFYTNTWTRGRSNIVRFVPKNGVYDSMETLPAPVLSKHQNYHASVSPDGSYLIFDSENREGLFLTFQKDNQEWTEPIDLSKIFNMDGALARISSDGKFIFFQAKGEMYWVDASIVNDLRPKD